MLAGSILGARRGFLSQLLFLVARRHRAAGAGRRRGAGSRVFAGPTAGYLLSWPIARVRHRAAHRAVLGALQPGLGRAGQRRRRHRGHLRDRRPGAQRLSPALPLGDAFWFGAAVFIPGDLVKAVVAARHRRPGAPQLPGDRATAPGGRRSGEAAGAEAPRPPAGRPGPRRSSCAACGHAYGERAVLDGRRPAAHRAADRGRRRQRLGQEHLRPAAQRAGRARRPARVLVDGLDTRTHVREVRRRVGLRLPGPRRPDRAPHGRRGRRLRPGEPGRAGGRARRAGRRGAGAVRAGRARRPSGAPALGRAEAAAGDRRRAGHAARPGSCSTSRRRCSTWSTPAGSPG